MLALHGIFPPIPTPFKPDQSLDFEALKSNLLSWNNQPLNGYVVAGSNGEAVSMSADERVDLIAAARDSIPESRLLIAGAGAQSSVETISLSKRMTEVGADAVIIVTPSYYSPSLDAAAFVDHYRRIADASPKPVLLYNVPVYTGLDLPVSVVLEMAEHANVIGLKDSGGNIAKIDAMVSGTDPAFQILVGSASILLAALVIGAVGCVPALGCIAADPIHELMEAYEAGHLEKARSLQAELVGPNQAVTSMFGVAGLKAAMDFVGMHGGLVRSPLQPLDGAKQKMLKDELMKSGLIKLN